MFCGERLRYLRKQKKMTQEYLAKELSLTRTSITNMEFNRIIPPLKTLERLSKIFNVSIYYFLDTTSDTINKLPFIIPRQFKHRNDCIEYLANREGLDKLKLEKLTDNELIEFSNKIQEYIEILSYKYKR